jgi:hypothetical protein
VHGRCATLSYPRLPLPSARWRADHLQTISSAPPSAVTHLHCRPVPLCTRLALLVHLSLIRQKLALALRSKGGVTVAPSIRHSAHFLGDSASVDPLQLIQSCRLIARCPNCSTGWRYQLVSLFTWHVWLHLLFVWWATLGMTVWQAGQYRCHPSPPPVVTVVMQHVARVTQCQKWPGPAIGAT